MDEATLIARVTEASTLTHTGRRAEAIALLEAMWNEASRTGDAYEACVVAHFMAHARDDAQAQLTWHLRALHAADAAGADRVRAFYPSLHANLAETYLRLGDGASARRHVEHARGALHLLDADAYGETVRHLVARLESVAVDRLD